ncbi:DUF5715 family protein [Prescottella subtropica]|uniref:DUF5715 family protein n=1 Tax=Prescottella subtropica TaxID=2545757 RepID=UPI0010F5D0AF|nr:hypothetical protein [Prescottella subtropica]
MTLPAIDFDGYRRRVDDLVDVLTGDGVPTGDAVARAVLDAPDVAAVLSRHPGGADHVAAALHVQVDGYTPNSRSSATDLSALIRIHLLHQIDVLWWGHAPRFATSEDVRVSPLLVDLDPLRRAGRLRFRYRGQAESLPQRIVRAADRRMRPRATPPSAGLRYRRALPETIALLNEIADEYARRCTDVGARSAARAGVWLNSAVRSEAHQEHLRGLGYSALHPSSHCSGYAIDVAVGWLRPLGGDRILQSVLVDRRDTGDINVIDEGPAWHVCPHPDAMPGLRATYDHQIGL